MSVLGTVIAFLPGFAWLFFYLEEDPHTEPKRFIFLTFLMGAAGAILAFAMQYGLQTAFPRLDLDIGRAGSTGVLLIAILAFSLIEEFCKFFMTKLSVVRNPSFSEPVDAMIYIIVAALGFATLENFGALHGNSAETIANPLSQIFAVISFRFVGATILHTLSSGLLGYYWAKSIREFGAKGPLVKGFIFATLVHAIFNYLILSYGAVVVPILFLIIVGFFVLGDFETLKHERV